MNYDYYQNMYNPNLYNQRQNFQNMQPVQPMQNIQPNVLQGKKIESLDMVKVAEIPLDRKH